MNDHVGHSATMQPENRKRNVRRTAFWLALLALAFYFGFIALAMVRGS